MARQLSLLDRIITEVDHAVKTILTSASHPTRQSPAKDIVQQEALNETEAKQSTGYMRVDHTGEICAQALYRGQALVAKSEDTRTHLLQAADEEHDHLAWCQERLTELESRQSLLNPFWYLGSFAIGATAGLISDKVSYGFVMETEHQVMKHLDSHLKSLPANDTKSRAILQQMYIDEAEHAVSAEKQGGAKLPFPIKIIMKAQSKVMTTTAYHL